MLRTAFLRIWVPFGAMQSCSEQLILEIRPCVKVRYLFFVIFVCIRALLVIYRVTGSLSTSCKHGGRSKVCLINTTSYLVPGFISNHQV